MKNGKKLKRRQDKRPVEYLLHLGFKLTSSDPSGMSVGGDLEVPIRKGFGEKFDRIKKGDVVVLLRQLAEAIEKEDYSMLGLPVDMSSVTAAARKASQKLN